MQASLQVLATGSSGNAILVRIGAARLLVDAGLPYPALAARLGRAGVPVGELDAVLVSHEHADHTRALAELRARHPSVPVLATSGTARAVGRDLAVGLDGTLRSEHGVAIGDAAIVPFAVSHDAAEPVGFRLERGDFALAVATDLGEVTAVVRQAFAGCRAVVIEANHDLELLARGPYPPFLKRRVASRRGHLSNAQMAGLLRAVAGPWLHHVTLAHASATNNSPERALAAAAEALARHRGVAVTVAERDRASEAVAFAVVPSGRPAARFVAAPVVARRSRQLSLFDEAPPAVDDREEAPDVR